MKKTILFSLFLLWLIGPGLAQNLSIQGVVSNEENGEPVVGHEVFVGIESGNDLISEHIVFTDGEGEFILEMPLDTIEYNQGVVNVSVMGCEQTMYEESENFHANSLELEFEFEICVDSIAIEDCEAEFYWNPVFEQNQETLEVEFTDVSNGDPTAWMWTFGDGNESDEQNPVHEYEEDGDYEVCLTIFNEDGTCQDMFCDVVFVGDSIFNEDCEAEFYWNPVFEQNQETLEVEFTDVSFGVPTAWMWTFGDGNESDEQNPVHEYEEEGEYEVCLTIFNEEGTCQDVFCDMVFVGDSIFNEDCEAAFYWYPATDSLQQQEEGIQFMDMSYGEITSWMWSFGDGNESDEQNPVHVYDEEGEYEVCLTIFNEEGTCQNMYCDVVFVGDSIFNEDCEAAFYWYPATDSLQQQEEGIQFMDMSYGEITSWMWTFGDGNESDEQNPIHVYDEEGEYEVCLTIFNEEGTCQNMYCDVVFVGDSIFNEDCEAAFYWYPATDSLQQQEEGIQFMDMSYGEITSWMWTFGDGNESDEQNPIHVYDEEGEYEVCLTIFNEEGTCQNMYCDVVFVGDSIFNEDCEAYFEVQPIGDSLNQNQIMAYQFMDVSMGEPTAWYWDFGDGSESEQQNPVHEYAEEGIYMVCLYIENEEETCMSSYCMAIQVGEVETYTVSGTVYANEEYLEAGEVLIIGEENNFFEYAVIDSLGMYHFQNVPEGAYYLWAFPSMQDEQGLGFVPTFYQNALSWEDANLIYAENDEDYDIELLSIEELLDGVCGIDGSISNSGRGSAYHKANVILTDEFDQVFQYELTELNGEFDFENLNYGTYKVHVEVVGIVSEPVTITLDEQNTQTTLNYSVEGGNILLSASDADQTVQTFSIGKLFPNPATDVVNVPVILKDRQAINVSVYDVTGRMVKSIINQLPHGSHIVRIDTQNLKQGIYQVMIQTNSGEKITKKLVK